MFTQVVLAEESKLLRRLLVWVELALLAGLVLFLAWGLGAVGTPDEQRQVLWPLAPLTMLELGMIFGPFFTVVLVGAAVAQDYCWRTVHLWLSHGVPRPTLLLGKLVALCLPLLLLMLVPLLVGAPVTALLTLQRTGAVDVGAMSFGGLTLGVVRGATTLLPYAAATLLLGVLTRNTIGPLAGGIALVMGENLLGQVLTAAGPRGMTLLRLLPAGLATSIAHANAAAVGKPVDVGLAAVELMLPPPLALVGILGYTLLFGGLALWFFQRQDLTG